MKDFMSGYKTYDTSKGYGSRSQWKKAFRERMTTEEARAIIEEQDSSPWSILGLHESATQSEIKKAYRDLILQWHPDRCQRPDAEEMTKKIIAAYTILNNETE